MPFLKKTDIDVVIPTNHWLPKSTLTDEQIKAQYKVHTYMILDGLEGDTRIYCQRC